MDEEGIGELRLLVLLDLAMRSWLLSAREDGSWGAAWDTLGAGPEVFPLLLLGLAVVGWSLSLLGLLALKRWSRWTYLVSCVACYAVLTDLGGLHATFLTGRVAILDTYVTAYILYISLVRRTEAFG